MQISLSTEYAVHSLVYLAVRPRSEAYFVEEIATVQNISPSYLAKVFRRLAKAGILNSFRGAKGGYKLAIEPHELTLRKVVEAIEGKTPIFKCHEEQLKCTLGVHCYIKTILNGVETAVYEALEKNTIADIVYAFKTNGGEPEWLNIKKHTIVKRAAPKRHDRIANTAFQEKAM